MTALLVIIYVSFISLGLPDSILGSAWPVMHMDLGVSVANAGIISMIIAGGTIISSFFSDRMIRKLGTGLITLISVAMTALALVGFSFSNHFFLLCLWAIPLGLGAGSVDASLNNFVALHYKARHMSWLHCFWGVGASAGPLIMSFALVQWSSWQAGYRTIGILQFVLVGLLFVSFPLWKKAQEQKIATNHPISKPLKFAQLLKLPGAKPALLTFFLYCAIEATVGLWGSSYLVSRNISPEVAASWIALYYAGITIGRFASGFLTMKLKHKQMVQLGEIFIGAGVVLLFLPFSGNLLLVSLFLIGVGCAPIFPSLLHETPDNFGSEYSQSIMGIQMSCAYVGITFMPPLFGLLGQQFGYNLFPIFIAILLILMIFMVRVLYQKVRKHPIAENEPNK